jgi:hypothetical protein
MSEPLTRDRDEYLRRVEAEIVARGWHVTVVEDTPRYAHTTGLTRSFAHPEILVIGLPITSIASVVDEVAQLVANGTVFKAHDVSHEVFEGLEATFREVPLVSVLDYCAAATAFYGLPPKVLQLVWPDANGHWPWDWRADARAKLQQPVLSELAGGGDPSRPPEPTTDR